MSKTKVSSKMKPLLIIAAALLCSCALGQAKPKVLLIARDKALYSSISKEVLPMLEQLRASGFKVDVASQTGTPIESAVGRLVPDLKLSAAKLEEYRGVIVPCMGVTFLRFPGKVPEGAVPLILAALDKGIPVAIAHSPELLDAAELRPRFAVSDTNERGVVRDGLLITSYVSPEQEYFERQSRLPVRPLQTAQLVSAFVGVIREGQD